MKNFKNVLFGILIFFLIAAFSMVIVWICVVAGMSIFGTEAFGAELPSIEEPCGLSKRNRRISHSGYKISF